MQAELERRGIATASITMLPEITRAVRAPRALAVPWKLGYPLGAPADADLQTRVLRRLIALSTRTDVPLIEEL